MTRVSQVCRIVVGAIVLCGAPVWANDTPVALTERCDWASHFDAAGVAGTVVVIDERPATAGAFVYNADRAGKRYAPASTFKIPHTLMALQHGAVRDEFQVFAWDGVARAFSGHNQDQDLRSAMRYSALWVYQRFAAQIGTANAQRYLRSIGYGNADITTAAGGDYWVDGALTISAVEQVLFLRKLYRNALPFSVAHQRLVKDLLINEADYDWILRAKTGWEGRFGWWVGWVEWPQGPVFFALNIDTPRRMEDLPKRQEIAKAVLRSVQALPMPGALENAPTPTPTPAPTPACAPIHPKGNAAQDRDPSGDGGVPGAQPPVG